MSNKTHSIFSGGLLLFTIYFLQSPLSAEAVSREYTIKAGLILKFTDFIKWPDGSSNNSEFSTYQLCVLGGNRFGNIFSQGKKEGLFKKNIVLKHNMPNQELKTCNILFLTGDNQENLRQALNLLKNEPVLIISESEGYGELGAGINLVQRNNKIKFEINRDALQAKGLEVSSRLLNIAILVGEDLQ